MNAASYAAVFAIGVVVIVAGYIVLASYNAVMALRQRIDKAWSNIGVVLQQRHDQLPNLVAAVRGLMAYEQDVLTEVTRARAAYTPTAPIPAQAGGLRADERARSGPCSPRSSGTRRSSPRRTSPTCRTRSSGWRG